MMKNFRGLCIGGPEDGKWLASIALVYRIPIPTNLDSVEVIHTQEPYLKIYEYSCKEFYVNYSLKYIWLAEEFKDWSLSQIFDHLIANYKSPEKENDEKS